MDHPQHCQQLAEQIAAETDEAKREKLREQFPDECQDDGVDAMRSGTTDSGGGGTGNPPRPPVKPGTGG